MSDINVALRGLVVLIERQIFDVLKKSDISLTINEVADRINAHRTTTSKYLAVLEARGIVKCRNVGKAKLYSVSDGNVKVKRMKSSVSNNLLFLEALVITFILLVCSVYFVSAAGNFNCTIITGGTCAAGNTSLIFMENDTGGYLNAHAQNVSVGTYSYEICCNSTSSLYYNCDEGVFLKLNTTTNSHVQQGDYSGPGIVYGIDACITADPGYFNCTYVDDSCPADRECVASIGGTDASDNRTNAHIGPCSAYKRKACCRVLDEISVTYENPTPPNYNRETSNSVTINVSVSTDAGVSTDTCILGWIIDAGGETNETMEMVGSGSSVTCNITKATNDGTNYTFRVYANDTGGAWGSESAREIQENDEPAQVTLISPADGSSTTDRTPTFSWNQPSDADNDPLTYTINITCFPGCSDDNRYVSGIGSTSYTPTYELQYFGDDNYLYNWSVHANDGYENGSWSDKWNLTIDTNVSIVLINDTVDFGSNRVPGYTDDSTDNDPYPFALRNIGNCLIDVNISSSDLLWDSASQPSDYFNYSVAWVPGEGGAFNWSGSQTTETNIPQVDQNVSFIDYLNYTSGNNSAEIDIHIEVPTGEPTGTKSSTIVFTGEYEK